MYDVTFLSVNFPFIYSNIPAEHEYGVNIYRLMRCFKVCASYLGRERLLLMSELFTQEFMTATSLRMS